MKHKFAAHTHEINLLIAACVFNILIYNGGRFISQSRFHLCLATDFDDIIPFLPWTVYIYWICYLFWIVNYILAVKQSSEEADLFIIAHFIGETVCFIAFVFMPTTMVRAEITGNTLADQIMSLTYQIDSADNLLPSIHCFVSWLCWIGVRGKYKIPVWYQCASLFMAIAVCISTLTVKQHVIVDVIAGIILAEFSYLCSGFIQNIREIYSSKKSKSAMY